MGERVLVSGAAGGVGTAGVQLAREAGAIVTATVRDAEHRRAVADLGAHAVIAPGDEGGHGPYDVVLELVGQASLTNVSAPPGHLVPGRRHRRGLGRPHRDRPVQLMTKRARIGGSTLRARSRREKADVAAAVAAHVLPALAAGRLRVPLCATFPLVRGGRGLRAVRRRRQVRQGGARRLVIEAVLVDGEQTLGLDADASLDLESPRGQCDEVTRRSAGEDHHAGVGAATDRVRERGPRPLDLAGPALASELAHQFDDLAEGRGARAARPWRAGRRSG